jgi:uncharacterized membrane protein
MRDAGIDAWLIKGIFEVNLLLLFAICLTHSLRTHGWRRTLREFGAGFMLTACCESLGVLSGAYVYPGFELYIFATPVGNPASWVALVYVIMVVTDGIIYGRKAVIKPELPVDGETSDGLGPGRPLLKGSLLTTLLVLATVDATLALLLDLVLDPLATIYNWWIWVPCEEGVTQIAAGVVEPYNFEHLVWLSTPDNALAEFFAPFFDGQCRYPTRVIGIPLINFIAWFVFVFVFACQFRWIDSRKNWSEWRRTGVLWGLVLLDVPVLGFILIAPNI